MPLWANYNKKINSITHSLIDTHIIHITLGMRKQQLLFHMEIWEKNIEHDNVRTCPSTLRNLEVACSSATTSKVYKASETKHSPQTHLSVLQPRNDKLFENIRSKQLQQKRISHDFLYNLHELVFDLYTWFYSFNLYLYRLSMHLWSKGNSWTL